MSFSDSGRSSWLHKTSGSVPSFQCSGRACVRLCYFFFKCSEEFTGEAISAWKFLCEKVLIWRFNLFIRYRPFRFSVSSFVCFGTLYLSRNWSLCLNCPIYWYKVSSLCYYLINLCGICPDVTFIVLDLASMCLLFFWLVFLEVCQFFVKLLISVIFIISFLLLWVYFAIFLISWDW